MPSNVAPSMGNATDPVGAPEPLDRVTVAVEQYRARRASTDSVWTDGAAGVVVAVNAPLPTVSAVAVPAEVLKKLSPRYTPQ